MLRGRFGDTSGANNGLRRSRSTCAADAACRAACGPAVVLSPIHGNRRRGTRCRFGRARGGTTGEKGRLQVLRRHHDLDEARQNLLEGLDELRLQDIGKLGLRHERTHPRRTLGLEQRHVHACRGIVEVDEQCLRPVGEEPAEIVIELGKHLSGGTALGSRAGLNSQCRQTGEASHSSFRPPARTARRQRLAASAFVPQATLRRRAGRGATARR